MDSASLFMFAVTFILALLFSIVALFQIHVKDLYDFIIGFFSSLVAAVCWGVFATLWPVAATSTMYVSIAYLFSGFSAIFIGFVFVYIILYVVVATDPKRRQEAALTIR